MVVLLLEAENLTHTSVLETVTGGGQTYKFIVFRSECCWFESLHCQSTIPLGNPLLAVGPFLIMISMFSSLLEKINNDRKREERVWLPTLQARQKWISNTRMLMEKDIVLFAEKQRDEWPLEFIKGYRAEANGLNKEL